LRKIAIVGGMIALPTPEARDAQADFIGILHVPLTGEEEDSDQAASNA
jgi:hypothetical protein